MKFYMLWVKEPFTVAGEEVPIRPFIVTHELTKLVEGKAMAYHEEEIYDNIFFNHEDLKDALGHMLDDKLYFIMELET